MNLPTICVLNTGLVTSVGSSSPATCAAIRARISNPSETAFIDSNGEPIFAHQVILDRPWRGTAKLAQMAVMSIEESLSNVPRADWGQFPLLLCVAERDRPGRLDGLDEDLFVTIQQELQVQFSGHSLIIPHGRVSVADAFLQARKILDEGLADGVVIAATDSFVSWPALRAIESQDRLLTSSNSNGFIVGEGAGALFIGPRIGAGHLTLSGLGLAIERSGVEGNTPLRSDGLSQAFMNCLNEAKCKLHDIDFRITDLSGEQYYFKEAALALGRTLKQRREEFEMWHPAESIGETGALAGVACVAVASLASKKSYALGKRILIHLGTDCGRRAALVFQAD